MNLIKLVSQKLNRPDREVIMGTLKERDKEFKKQVIAETAYELFYSKPYESVTVDDIARSVGCGKGTLYQYFKNKDHILTYLVSQGLEKLCSDMEEKCMKNSDLLSAINNYLILQYYFFLEHNQIYSSWARRKLDNSISEDWITEIYEKLERKVKMVAAIIEKGIEEKIFIPVESYEMARIMENIVRDSTFSVMEDRSINRDPHKILALIKRVLFHGILIKKDPVDEPG